jgi:hypothetical protein
MVSQTIAFCSELIIGSFYQNRFMTNIIFEHSFWIFSNALWFVITSFNINSTIRYRQNSTVYKTRMLSICAVDTWAVRFRSGKTSVEDDETLGNSSRNDFSGGASGYLKRNSHASCCEMAKASFISRTIILRTLAKMNFRFFVAK